MAVQRASERLILFVALGFGSGRIPIAPGTFGSIVGLFWTGMLLLANSAYLYLAGIILGFFVSVWLGGRAEEILKLKDPGCIVIDEIAAVPLAFFPAVLMTPPLSGSAFSVHWPGLLLAFVLFRFFDVLKPLGIRHVQSLPGGWGLTVDDYLAAACVMPFTWGFYLWRFHA